jgi:hypothetical protein
VIEGIPGHELFGYARLWYEVDAYRDVLGVGLAQRLMHRMGSYTRDRSDFDTQLSLELYATIRL